MKKLVVLILMVVVVMSGYGATKGVNDIKREFKKPASYSTDDYSRDGYWYTPIWAGDKSNNELLSKIAITLDQYYNNNYNILYVSFAGDSWELTIVGEPATKETPLRRFAMGTFLRSNYATPVDYESDVEKYRKSFTSSTAERYHNVCLGVLNVDKTLTVFIWTGDSINPVFKKE